MFEFFLKHKKVRGVITVFLTIIYLSVYLLIGIFVDGGRIRMAQTMVEDVQQIATENVMSQYNRGLYEYYGLFGVDNYDVDKISEDIKKQIDEVMGNQLSNEIVESYIGNLSDENDIGKKFDPYGLKVENIKTNYISLADPEALRAQIRDEMRYTAPMVLGADFFDTVNAFMSMLNGVKALTDVTNKIANNSDKIQERQKAYKLSLDRFSSSFKDFIKESYKPRTNPVWGTIASVTQTLGSLYNNWVTQLNNFFHGRTTTSDGDDNDQYEIETDLNLKGTNGLEEIVRGNDENILAFYDEFDDTQNWPQPSDYIEEDEYGNEHYDHDGHRAGVYAEATDRASNYNEKVDIILNKAELALRFLNETISPSIDNYMRCIGIVENEFKDGCSKVDGKIAKNIYMQYMVQQLDAWNYLAEQKKCLNNIKDKLEQIISLLNEAKVEAIDLCSDIESDVNRSWHQPSANRKLKISRDRIANEFNDLIIEMVQSENEIITVQNSAVVEKDFRELLKVINDFSKNALKTADEFMHTVEEDKVVCGTIVHHAEETKNIDEDEIEQLKSLLEEEINEDNIIEKLAKVLDFVSEIFESIQYELFASIYDETYILSHCRDYVHTFRYEEEEIYKQNDAEKALNNIDTVLNPKFVEDRHKTNYLTNKQLKKLQVTPAEIEYILFGNPTTYKNVETIYWIIYWMRFAMNCLSACTTVEFPILASGPWALVTAPAGLMAYALPQTESEIRSIMFKCEKTNIVNFGGHIYDPAKDMALDYVKSVVVATAEDAAERNHSIDVSSLIDSVDTNNIEPDDNISNATSFLSVNASDIYMQYLTMRDAIVEAIPKSLDDIINIVLPKAGYSDYITMFLFRQSRSDKKTQISRLQDVIETNMSRSKAGQPNFRLKDAYSQISVETESSVKYIFMSQSFMKRTFSNADGYKNFSIKVKTAFAY